MKIETKYNIGDEVWWKEKDDNTPHSGIISAIRISVFDQASNIGIQYGVKNKSFDGVYYMWFWDFYSTKEELLKSL